MDGYNHSTSYEDTYDSSLSGAVGSRQTRASSNDDRNKNGISSVLLQALDPSLDSTTGNSYSSVPEGNFAKEVKLIESSDQQSQSLSVRTHNEGQIHRLSFNEGIMVAVDSDSSTPPAALEVSAGGSTQNLGAAYDRRDLSWSQSSGFQGMELITASLSMSEGSNAPVIQLKPKNQEYDHTKLTPGRTIDLETTISTSENNTKDNPNLVYSSKGTGTVSSTSSFNKSDNGGSGGRSISSSTISKDRSNHDFYSSIPPVIQSILSRYSLPSKNSNDPVYFNKSNSSTENKAVEIQVIPEMQRVITKNNQQLVDEHLKENDVTTDGQPLLGMSEARLIGENEWLTTLKASPPVSSSKSYPNTSPATSIDSPLMTPTAVEVDVITPMDFISEKSSIYTTSDLRISPRNSGSTYRTSPQMSDSNQRFSPRTSDTVPKSPINESLFQPDPQLSNSILPVNQLIIDGSISMSSSSKWSDCVDDNVNVTSMDDSMRLIDTSLNWTEIKSIDLRSSDQNPENIVTDNLQQQQASINFPNEIGTISSMPYTTSSNNPLEFRNTTETEQMEVMDDYPASEFSELAPPNVSNLLDHHQSPPYQFESIDMKKMTTLSRSSSKKSDLPRNVLIKPLLNSPRSNHTEGSGRGSNISLTSSHSDRPIVNLPVIYGTRPATPTSNRPVNDYNPSLQATPFVGVPVETTITENLLEGTPVSIREPQMFHSNYSNNVSVTNNNHQQPTSLPSEWSDQASSMAGKDPQNKSSQFTASGSDADYLAQPVVGQDDSFPLSSLSQEILRPDSMSLNRSHSTSNYLGGEMNQSLNKSPSSSSDTSLSLPPVSTTIRPVTPPISLPKPPITIKDAMTIGTSSGYYTEDSRLPLDTGERKSTSLSPRLSLRLNADRFESPFSQFIVKEPVPNEASDQMEIPISLGSTSSGSQFRDHNQVEITHERPSNSSVSFARPYRKPSYGSKTSTSSLAINPSSTHDGRSYSFGADCGYPHASPFDPAAHRVNVNGTIHHLVPKSSSTTSSTNTNGIRIISDAPTKEMRPSDSLTITSMEDTTTTITTAMSSVFTEGNNRLASSALRTPFDDLKPFSSMIRIPNEIDSLLESTILGESVADSSQLNSQKLKVEQSKYLPSITSSNNNSGYSDPVKLKSKSSTSDHVHLEDENKNIIASFEEYYPDHLIDDEASIYSRTSDAAEMRPPPATSYHTSSRSTETSLTTEKSSPKTSLMISESRIITHSQSSASSPVNSKSTRTNPLMLASGKMSSSVSPDARSSVSNYTSLSASNSILTNGLSKSGVNGCSKTDEIKPFLHNIRAEMLTSPASKIERKTLTDSYDSSVSEEDDKQMNPVAKLTTTTVNSKLTHSLSDSSSFSISVGDETGPQRSQGQGIKPIGTKPLTRERSYESYSSAPSAAKSDAPSKSLSLSASTSHSLSQSFEIPSPTAIGVRSESRSLSHGSTRTSASGSIYPARSDRSATSGSVAPLDSQRVSYAKLPHPSRKSEGSIDSYSESGEGGPKATINTVTSCPLSSKSSSSKPVPKSSSSSLYSSNSMSASSVPVVVVNPGVAIGQTSRSNSYSLSDAKLSRSISHSSTGSNSEPIPTPSITIRENKKSYSYASSLSSSSKNEKSSVNASSSSVGRKQSIGSESSSLKQTLGNMKQSSLSSSSLVRSSSGPKDVSDNMNLSVQDLPITPKKHKTSSSSSSSTEPKDELMASLYGSFADDVLKPVKLGAKDAPHKAFNNQFNRLFPFLDTEDTIKDNLNATTSLGWLTDSFHTSNNPDFPGAFPTSNNKGRLPGYFPFGTPDRFDHQQADLYQQNLRTMEGDQAKHDYRVILQTNKYNQQFKKVGWEWPSEAHARVLARRKARVNRLEGAKKRINEFSQSHMELSVGR